MSNFQDATPATLDEQIEYSRTHCLHGRLKSEDCECCNDDQRHREKQKRIGQALITLGNMYVSASYAHGGPTSKDWANVKYTARGIIRDLVEDWV